LRTSIPLVYHLGVGRAAGDDRGDGGGRDTGALVGVVVIT
jgi:hypothetical protein